uniref:Putative secreted protein n=1 Tax=Ixodes ricinus TaxID=34613 RepID=A0A6B0U403_IXORI
MWLIKVTVLIPQQVRTTTTLCSLLSKHFNKETSNIISSRVVDNMGFLMCCQLGDVFQRWKVVLWDMLHNIHE